MVVGFLMAMHMICFLGCLRVLHLLNFDSELKSSDYLYTILTAKEMKTNLEKCSFFCLFC